MKKLCMILLAALLLLSAACASPTPQETAAPKDVSVVTSPENASSVAKCPYVLVTYLFYYTVTDLAR